MSNFIGGDTLGGEDLVVLEIIIVSRVVEVGRSVVLLTIRVLFSFFGR